MLIYKNPESVFFDTAEENYIAIKKLFYNGKVRMMMIAYEHNDEGAEILTIHPIKSQNVTNRIRCGRWIENA